MEQSITVQTLILTHIKELGISRVIENNALGNKIEAYRPQKTALGVTGLTESLHCNRIQIFGNSELIYLENLPEITAEENLRKIMKEKAVPCFVITNGNEVPRHLKKVAEEFSVALFASQLKTEFFIDSLNEILREFFVPEATIHAALVDVHGMGLLIKGESGIGKSETVLELVTRGHRFISDDVVKVKKIASNVLVGHTLKVLRHFLEIRGLGVINIKDLFGITSVRNSKRIQLVIELIQWDPGEDFDRIGIDDEYEMIMGVQIPYLKLPLRQGKDIATIVEIAARNEISKLLGINAAHDFHQRVIDEISINAQKAQKAKDMEE